MPFDREQMKVKAAELAARGVYVGTSSWKYGSSGKCVPKLMEIGFDGPMV
jgi:hypothetical protein